MLVLWGLQRGRPYTSQKVQMCVPSAKVGD